MRDDRFALPPPSIPSLAISGTDKRFPIRRVFCVGRNYAAHSREMGRDPTSEAPFFFMKPADAVVPADGVVPYPSLTTNLHHEVELVVALSQGGSNISREDALEKIWGYGVGVDLTRRDLQDVAKQMSRPWDWSKGFDSSAPCTDLLPVSTVGHPSKGRIWLEINGSLKQEGDLLDLIWPVADVIAFASQAVELRPGDLFFTGTPSGVGPINRGERVRGGVDGVGSFEFTVL